MKSVFRLLWGITFLASLDLLALEKKSSLQCIDPIFNFGTVEDSQTIRHLFVLRNQGSQPIHILGVQSSCGCTLTQVSSEVIEPGAEVHLAVELSLAGQKGEIAKWITVESNDPECPMLSLRMEGVAMTRIAVIPSTVSWGEIGPAHGDQRVLHLVAGDQVIFHLKEVKYDTRLLKVAWESLREGKEYRLSVSLQKPLFLGKINTAIEVVTDYSEKSLIRIPVQAMVLDEIDVYPAEIVLMKGGEQDISRTLVIRTRGTKKLEIKEVKLPSSDLQYRIDPFGEKDWILKLSHFPLATQLVGKSLMIQTDSAGREWIRIPFRVVEEKLPSL